MYSPNGCKKLWSLWTSDVHIINLLASPLDSRIAPVPSLFLGILVSHATLVIGIILMVMAGQSLFYYFLQAAARCTHWIMVSFLKIILVIFL